MTTPQTKRRSKATSKRAAASTERALSVKQQRFVDEYLVDGNGTRAAIRAGYSEHTAAEQATRLLKDPRVKAAIEKALAAQSKRTKISADRVLEEWWSIATATANDLVEFRRTCCRHCHGIDFKPQHTKHEQASRRAVFALRKNPSPSDVFDQEGGEGFDARRSPHPSCPECFGEGVPSEFFKDTRTLSPDALRLYGGVKMTKFGPSIIMRDQDGALDRLGRHFGLLKEKPDDDGNETEEQLLARLAGLFREAAERRRAVEGHE